MSDPADLSFAARFMKDRGELRERILANAEFGDWIGQFKQLEIDDERLYVVGGDMLKDRDELVLEWARRQKLVTQDEIDQYVWDEESS
jgi:hypothetical protein